MHDVTIIDVNENERIRVVYDESPSNPRVEFDGNQTGALTVNGDRNRIDVEPVHTFPGDLRDASDRLLTTTRIQRWAHIFYDIHVEADGGTLWWVDPDALTENFWSMATNQYEYGQQPIDKVQLEKQIIAAEQAEYQAWAEGSVYGVIVEKRQRYVAVIDSGSENIADTVDWGDTLDTWEEVESCYGYYLDPSRGDDEQFREFANEMYTFE